MFKLKNIIKSYFDATSIQIDIWEIVINTEEDGEIIEIENNQKITIKDPINKNNNNNTTSLRKNFISNFSLGVDARIGYGIKKHKSKNKCLNFFSYLWESCKKKFCRRTMKLNDMIDSFSIINREELDNIMDETIENLNISKCENMSSRNALFRTLNKDRTLNASDKDENEKHIFWEDNKMNDNLSKHKYECN